MIRETSRMSLDDLGERRGVPFDRLQRMRVLLRRHHPRLQHPRVAEDGVERRPQLVRQRRQKLVLETVGRLRFFVRARVVDGQRRAKRHVLRESKVVVAVGAARFGSGQGQRAEASGRAR